MGELTHDPAARLRPRDREQGVASSNDLSPRMASRVVVKAADLPDGFSNERHYVAPGEDIRTLDAGALVTGVLAVIAGAGSTHGRRS